jgi:predicted GNAT superfamily acetyltransferase
VDAAFSTPRKALLVAQAIGGQVVGAFDTELPGAAAEGGPESLVGYAMAWPGIRTVQGAPQAYLHSDMLAVRAAWRNRGIGARLKWEQRREAVSRGIRRMEWTFDPLEIKNAFLNIHRLGAIVCRYRMNFYGVSSSQQRGALPSDRLLAEWHLDSPRVYAVFAGRQAAGANAREAASEWGIEEERILARIRVPASIYEWRAPGSTPGSNLEKAHAVQLENRLKFQQAFSQGLAVLGFVRDAEGNGVFELGVPAQAELASDPEERKNL